MFDSHKDGHRVTDWSMEDNEAFFCDAQYQDKND